MNLQERIKQRIWRCNEVSEMLADNYARIAVSEMRKDTEYANEAGVVKECPFSLAF